MISIEGLSVEFGGNPLFDDITYVINKKDRIALVGKNGAGKSTMLKIIAGLQQPTSGTVNIPKDMTIGYLPQQMQISDSRTVMKEAEQAFAHIFELQSRIDRMNRELSDRTDYDSQDYHDLIERVADANEQLTMIGAANYQAEIEKTLIGLGFVREDFDRPTSEFSGGWRMRIELAKLLLRRPDVLLLDEPLAALDLKLRKDMQQELKNIQKATGITFVFVTHDQEEALTMSDKIVVMNAGEIQQIGTPTEIYRTPVNEFVAKFIGETNIIDGVMLEDDLVMFEDKKYASVYLPKTRTWTSSSAPSTSTLSRVPRVCSRARSSPSSSRGCTMKRWSKRASVRPSP